MEYVEMLRARRTLTVYAIALLVGFVLTTIGILSSPHHSVTGVVHVSDLVAGAMFGALIIASIVACGLQAEWSTTAITWTRPRPREAIAWGYVAVDFAAIVVAFVITLLVALAIIALVGGFPNLQFDGEHVLRSVVIGFGVTMMWYGLIWLVAARFPGHSSRIAALSWAVFLIVGGLSAANLPWLLHTLIVALNFLNPLAYIDSGGSSSNTHPLIALSPWLRGLVAWAIAAVAIVVSIRLWSTREA
ncbi:MAG: hypothetical protein JO103_02865 [Candidatus Eremiobacteraeota bacterium]|nr:hypothetical protein [Candidatus Eremiobacteraeota bacterium]